MPTRCASDSAGDVAVRCCRVDIRLTAKHTANPASRKDGRVFWNLSLMPVLSRSALPTAPAQGAQALARRTLSPGMVPASRQPRMPSFDTVRTVPLGVSQSSETKSTDSPQLTQTVPGWPTREKPTSNSLQIGLQGTLDRITRCLFHTFTASSLGLFLGSPRSSVASGAGLEPGAPREKDWRRTYEMAL